MIPPLIQISNEYLSYLGNLQALLYSSYLQAVLIKKDRAIADPARFLISLLDEDAGAASE